MKTLFLIIFVFLFITHSANGQTIYIANNKSTPGLNDNYLKKYKTNKTIGWVLLSSGIGMIIGGGISYATYASQGYNGPAPVTAEALFLIIGPGAALVSVPFFISAKRNKQKAALVIKEESIHLGNKMFYKCNYTALALTIQLGTRFQPLKTIE